MKLQEGFQETLGHAPSIIGNVNKVDNPKYMKNPMEQIDAMPSLKPSKNTKICGRHTSDQTKYVESPMWTFKYLQIVSYSISTNKKSSKSASNFVAIT